MHRIALVLGFAAGLAAAAALTSATPAGAQAGTETAAKPKAGKAKVKRSKAKPGAKKAKAAAKAGAGAAAAPDQAEAAQADPKADAPAGPSQVAFAKLPKTIQLLHACARVTGSVEMVRERFATSVVFIVSCPAKERGGLQRQAVYVARDVRATGARRVTFESLAPDGTAATLDTVPSAVPAREAFVKDGDDPRNVQARNDPAWISGAWGPDDRPGVCAVTANWRIQGDKGELWLWEEAKECPKDATPKYERKLDKQPPPLVGR